MVQISYEPNSTMECRGGFSLRKNITNQLTLRQQLESKSTNIKQQTAVLMNMIDLAMLIPSGTF